MDLFLLVLFLDVIFKNRVFAVVTLTCDDFFNFSDLDSKINDTFSADCEDQQLLNLTASPDVSGETVVLLAVGLSEYCKSWISCVFECTKSQVGADYHYITHSVYFTVTSKRIRYTLLEYV
ncbi:uncharacterized protein LOC132737008 isoform X2 [Ruditapes philippinarum]|uniref:uncharacterized protein LOC132737008 isoform X2 n=1 Tax=Ruditapes philippinarum TaxID=129788 RepID=UPI00295C003C|nr:uncharacterized protein LOC132737008 isoform X2 [Ruditapes philippinarum]